MPPEPREMVAYYTAHKLCLGWGYLFFVGGTALKGLGLLRGLPMHFLQSAMEPSSAPPSQKEIKEPPPEADSAPKCTESFLFFSEHLT